MCMCIGMCMSEYVYVCLYVYVHVNVHVYEHVYVHVCTRLRNKLFISTLSHLGSVSGVASPISFLVRTSIGFGLRLKSRLPNIFFIRNYIWPQTQESPPQ